MVLLTLREMAKGGMNDQLGGGFHRYSVDERWFVPHFEKMLYDQAQLAVSYLEAFQITRDGQYAAAARDIFSYVLRDLTHPDGGFYSAEDADSAPIRPIRMKNAKAHFMCGPREEIEDALAPARCRDVPLPVRRRGRAATWKKIRTANFAGAIFCIRRTRIEETALHAKVRMEEARAILKSPAPSCSRCAAPVRGRICDDKILTAWNGLMISAFAKGAQILDEPRYADAARGAASFMRRHLWDETRGVLLRRYRDGEAAIDGFLDDYAFL